MPALKRAEPQAARRSAGAGAGRSCSRRSTFPSTPDAVAFALDSAVELGQRLVVANFVERAPLPLSAMLGYDDLPCYAGDGAVPSRARAARPFPSACT